MIRLTPESLDAYQSRLDESALNPRASVVRLPVRDADAHRRRTERRSYVLLGATLCILAFMAWRWAL